MLFIVNLSEKMEYKSLRVPQICFAVLYFWLTVAQQIWDLGYPLHNKEHAKSNFYMVGVKCCCCDREIQHWFHGNRIADNKKMSSLLNQGEVETLQWKIQ